MIRSKQPRFEWQHCRQDATEGFAACHPLVEILIKVCNFFAGQEVRSVWIPSGIDCNSVRKPLRSDTPDCLQRTNL